MRRLGSVDMREALVGMALVLVLIVTGCGGGEPDGNGEDDGSYTKDDIARALGFHREAHETITRWPLARTASLSGS